MGAGENDGSEASEGTLQALNALGRGSSDEVPATLVTGGDGV